VPTELSCSECLADSSNEVCIDSWNSKLATCCSTQLLTTSEESSLVTTSTQAKFDYCKQFNRLASEGSPGYTPLCSN